MNFFKRRSFSFIAIIFTVFIIIFLICRNHTESNSFNLVNGTHNVKHCGNFEYKILPRCSSANIIWLITSYAGNTERRNALRTVYIKEELDTLGIQRIFLLGQLPTGKNPQQRDLEIESSIYKDVVQGTFIEAYRNLTCKHLMGLNWASKYCKPKSYIIKMDDDIIINIYEILPKLNIQEKHFLMGYALRKMIPLRDPKNKWFITKEEFKKDVFPDFVSGWLYITNVETAGKLVRQSQKDQRFFWIDDVYVTGILREELDVKIIDIHKFYATDYRFLECCIKGMSNNSKCEYVAGPDGAQNDLLSNFQKYAKFCYNNSCVLQPVEKTCVFVYKEKLLHIPGQANVQIL